jgi:GTP-binding protein HflX
VATGDRLFETLDATTRVLRLPLKETVLLSDTVGFIRKIPHDLVASFHATLECVVEADLVIHVADLSHHDYEGQIATVRAVMEEIGAPGKHEILVLNKVDRVEDEDTLKLAIRRHEGAIPVSALHGWGADAVKEQLLGFAHDRKDEVTLLIPPEDGRTISYLHKYGTVIGRELVDGKMEVRVKMERRYLKPVEAYIQRSPPGAGE